MNCREFRRRQMDLLDLSPDPRMTDDLRRHLQTCPRCAREFSELQELATAMEPGVRACASPNLKERIMNEIADVQETEQSIRPARRRAWVFRLAFAAVLALGIIGYRGLTGSHGAPISPFETLAQAAESTMGLKSVHIKANMRTPKSDNFATTGPNYDFVPVEIWTVTGEIPKWRIEKPGRWVVMDGSTTTILMASESPHPMAIRIPGAATGTAEWLAPLLNLNTLMSYEKSLAQKQGSEVTCVGEETAEGGQIALTVKAKAQGDYSESDYMRNKTLYDSDNTRIYTFDARSHRLLGMRVSVDIDGQSTVVFETTAIEYDVPLDRSVFSGEIPKNASVYKDPAEMPVTGDNSSMAPQEVARAILTAMGSGDWDALHGYAGTFFDNPALRTMLGRLSIQSIGKPFRSGSYPGCFVPYEIRLKSGDRKSGNLAIRNDNPRHQWQFDGGL